MIAILLAAALSMHPAPPHLPDWIEIERHPKLRLRQMVIVHGDSMLVCRTLTNVSRNSVQLPILEPNNDSYEQFSTFVFDSHGTIWRERDNLWQHRGYVPPPPPPAEGAAPPSLTLAPRSSFRNCERLSKPSLRSFSLVSHFSPSRGVMMELHSPIEGTAAMSNTCYVRASKVECTR